MIRCAPIDSVDTDSAAVPPLMVTVPNEVDPSMKPTVPVAVPGETTAVNVTACPREAGSREEVSVTLDGGAGFTTRVMPQDKLWKFASPL